MVASDSLTAEESPVDAMGLELAEQTEVWRRLWDRRDQTAEVAEKALKGGLRRVVFTGCGDCHAAAEYAASFLGLRSRLDVRAFPAMELSRFRPDLLTEDTLLVALSVSGRTPRVLEAVRAGDRRSAHPLAITDNPEGPLVEDAEHRLFLETSPPEALGRTDYRDPGAAEYSGYHRAVPQTKTFGAMQFALALLCLRLEGIEPSGQGSPPAEVEAALRSLPELAPRAADAGLGAASLLAGVCRSRAFLSFCGSGLGYPAARFAAYKLMELTRPAGFGDVEEYCHTLYLVTEAGDGVCFFAQDDATLRRCREIAPVVAEEIEAQPVVLSTANSAVASPWEVSLPVVPPEVAPILFGYAGAHLVRGIARSWGLNTDRFRAGVEEERYVRGSTRMIRKSKILDI